MTKATQPPFEYLASASQTCLEGFELARLNQISAIRSEIQSAIEDWVSAEADARLARWLIERRRSSSETAARTSDLTETPQAELLAAFAGPTFDASAINALASVGGLETPASEFRALQPGRFAEAVNTSQFASLPKFTAALDLGTRGNVKRPSSLLKRTAPAEQISFSFADSRVPPHSVSSFANDSRRPASSVSDSPRTTANTNRAKFSSFARRPLTLPHEGDSRQHSRRSAQSNAGSSSRSRAFTAVDPVATPPPPFGTANSNAPILAPSTKLLHFESLVSSAFRSAGSKRRNICWRNGKLTARSSRAKVNGDRESLRPASPNPILLPLLIGGAASSELIEPIRPPSRPSSSLHLAVTDPPQSDVSNKFAIPSQEAATSERASPEIFDSFPPSPSILITVKLATSATQFVTEQRFARKSLAATEPSRRLESERNLPPVAEIPDRNRLPDSLDSMPAIDSPPLPLISINALQARDSSSCSCESAYSRFPLPPPVPSSLLALLKAA
jgi:hypothetical protein